MEPSVNNNGNNGNRGRRPPPPLPNIPKSDRQLLRNYLEMRYKEKRLPQQSRKTNKLRSLLATIVPRPRLKNKMEIRTAARSMYNEMRTKERAARQRNTSGNVQAAINALKAAEAKRLANSIRQAGMMRQRQKANEMVERAKWNAYAQSHPSNNNRVKKAQQTAELINREAQFLEKKATTLLDRIRRLRA